MKNSFSLALLSVIFLITAGSCRNETDKSTAVSQSFRFEEYTIDQLQQGYLDGNYTVTEVVQAYLDHTFRGNNHIIYQKTSFSIM